MNSFVVSLCFVLLLGVHDDHVDFANGQTVVRGGTASRTAGFPFDLSMGIAGDASRKLNVETLTDCQKCSFAAMSEEAQAMGVGRAKEFYDVEQCKALITSADKDNYIDTPFTKCYCGKAAGLVDALKGQNECLDKPVCANTVDSSTMKQAKQGMSLLIQEMEGVLESKMCTLTGEGSSTGAKSEGGRDPDATAGNDVALKCQIGTQATGSGAPPSDSRLRSCADGGATNTGIVAAANSLVQQMDTGFQAFSACSSETGCVCASMEFSGDGRTVHMNMCLQRTDFGTSTGRTSEEVSNAGGSGTVTLHHCSTHDCNGAGAGSRSGASAAHKTTISALAFILAAILFELFSLGTCYY